VLESCIRKPKDGEQCQKLKSGEILKYLPTGVRVIPQGEYVAESLKDYLERHPQIEQRCNKNGEAHYLTTENPDKFKEQAQIFLHESIEVENITLG